MKKRISAILLVICLAVACLPVSASAAEITDSRVEISDFLASFPPDYNPFDAERAAFFTNGDVLHYMARYIYVAYYSNHFNDQIYRGEDIQYYQQYIFNDNDPAHGQDSNFVPDPLGKFDSIDYGDYKYSGYLKIGEIKYNWILENIFNISPENISRLKSEYIKENRPNDYYYDGYYYYCPNGSGNAGSSVAINKMTKHGNMVYVTYDSMHFSTHYKCFAIVEPKTINGKVYWSLHYLASVELPLSTNASNLPDLPEEFGFEPPVLSPDIYDQGMCGKNSSWTLDNNGLLTISGEGEIELSFLGNGLIQTIVLEEGVSISSPPYSSAGVFMHCANLKTVKIPTSTTKICEYTFFNCNNLTDVYYGGTEEQWKQVQIREMNEPLLNATVHFEGQTETPPSNTPGTLTLTITSGGLGKKIITTVEGGHWLTVQVKRSGSIAISSIQALGSGQAEVTFSAPAGSTIQIWETAEEITFTNGIPNNKILNVVSADV